MTRIRGLLFLACAALAAATAVPAAAQTAADTAGRTGAVADSLLRACRGTFGVRGRCVEQALDGVLRSSGIGAAMAVLDRMVATNGGLAPQAHSIAHGLGIAAYQSPETVAAIFAHFFALS